MADRPRTLAEELAELERTDPEVAKAAAKLDKVSREIVSQARSTIDAARKWDTIPAADRDCATHLLVEAIRDHEIDAARDPVAAAHCLAVSAALRALLELADVAAGDDHKAELEELRRQVEEYPRG